MSSRSNQHYSWILWIRLQLWRLHTLILRQFWGDDCGHILIVIPLYVLYQRFCNGNGDFSILW